MGLGREVGDAYISVHGDLSDFRRDLEKAGPMTEKAAMEQATKFADAWGQRIESDVNGKWASIVDAMYSDKKLDWDRLVGKFDANGNLDAAEKKIADFMGKMAEAGTLTEEEYVKADDALKGMIGTLRDRNKAEAEHLKLQEQMREGAKAAAEANRRMFEEARRQDVAWNARRKKMVEDAIRENAAWNNRRKKTMEQAIAENERWARTFKGITKNKAIKDLNEDFKKLAEAMTDEDILKWGNRLGGDFERMRVRVKDVTDAMVTQGRISEENARDMVRNVNAAIGAQEQLRAATERTKEETARAKAETERYNKSLQGMIEASQLQQLEKDFRNLTDAIAAGDFSNIAKGHKNFRDMDAAIRLTTARMQALGRVTEQERAIIGRALDGMAKDQDKFTFAVERTNTALTSGSGRGGSFIRVMRGLGDATRGTREHLQGFAGLNVFGDMIRGGLDFIHNLDRIALKVAKTSLLLGGLAAVGGSALGGAAVIAQDMGLAVAGMSAALPGFLVGAGIGVGVLVASFKDLKVVLKDLGPQFSKLQDSISAKFWAQAEKPVRNLTKALFPTLNTQLQITGTRMGALTGAFADAFAGAASPERVTVMFERMNEALDIVKAAVAPLTRAFVNLGNAGSKQFQRFSTWVVKLSTQFDNFIQKAADSGELDQWIENGIKGFKDMGRAVDGTLGVFNAIASAARKAGNGGLSSFADKLQGMAATMQGPMFQGALTTFFEGANIAVSKIGAALVNLGPAIASIMPRVKIALSDVGSTIGTLINYVATVFENPAIQAALTSFTGNVKTAVDNLQPAIKPFSDSVAGMLDLLGKIAVSVADLVTVFVVNLSPVLDSMSKKMETLVEPLSNSAKKVVEAITPVLAAMDASIVGPLVSIVREKILPAFDGLVAKISPVFVQLVKDLGPAFTSVADALPSVIKLAGEVVDVVGDFLAKIGPPLATGVDAAVTSLEKFADGFAAALKKMREGDGGGAAGSALGGIFDGVGSFLSEAWKAQTERFEKGGDFGTENNKFWLGLWEGFKGNTEDFFNTKLPSLFNDINSEGGVNDTVNKFFDDSVFKPIREGWDNMWKGLGEWWAGVKTEFQKWMGNLLGFGDSDGDGFGTSTASVSGGAGGGAGRGIGGKIEKAMAMDDMSFMDRFKAAVAAKWEEFWTGVQETITTWGETIKTNWDTFWDGVGTKVTEIWDGVVLWVTTKAAEIQLNIETFIAAVQTGWTTFWDGVNTKVQEIWDAVVLWIQTKVEEIRVGIETWIASVKLAWDTFWDGVNTKVNEIWTAVTTWIQTKVTEIQTGIDSFITTVRTNWDNFWNGVNQTVTNIWNIVVAWISGKVGEIRGNIDRFIGDVRTNWDNFWNGVRDTVTTAWNNIVTGVETGVGNVINWVTSLPGKITGALGNLGGLLLNAGGAIMDGLRQGLENAWGGVQQFVGGIANWIAEHKGPISYDKVLLTPAGKAIMDGLGNGLKSRLSDLKNTLDLVTDTMANAVTDTFARSKMYVAGADAAKGLADGLKDSKNLVDGAFAGLVPDASLSLKARGVGGPTPGGPTRIINIGEGAISVTTPTKDPGLVASRTIDELAATTSTL